MLSVSEAQQVLKDADLLISQETVSAAVQRLALDITQVLQADYPLVLSVMGGAVVFTGQLLPQLYFPLSFDYLHVTRYGNDTIGGQLRWIATPRESVKGRTVLILDDILDEGITLSVVKQRMLEWGALSCYTAVFADKEIGQVKPVVPDFVGITLPNRYVFGFGMDISGAWRNLPAIYAVKT
jgi:hypoxanthine phosphoribosyltransferase